MGMLRLFLPHCQRSKEGFDLETASVSSFQLGFVAFASCNFPVYDHVHSKLYGDVVHLHFRWGLWLTFLKICCSDDFK